MITKTITVEIPAGLEVRPVAVLVQVANQYSSSIYVESGNKKVNAKSIMGLMTLGLRAGESVTVHADGSDEEDAVDKIEAYLTGIILMLHVTKFWQKQSFDIGAALNS